MDLNAISVFARVVEAGSFTDAARRLEMPKSTVSLRVSQLEQTLGVTLLHRTTRRLSLTEDGRRYYAACTQALAALETAETTLTRAQRAPRGTLRITASVNMGLGIIGDVIAGFLEEHPNVEVDLLLTSRVVDLLAENLDIAVRAGPLRDSRMKARLVGTSVFKLYASPEYLKGRRMPTHPHELKDHDCLRLTFATDKAHVYDLRHGRKRVRVPVRGRFSANEIGAVRKLAAAGLGIAFLPESSCMEELRRGRLVPVLPEWSSESTPVHLVFPAQRFVAPKVQAFVTYAARVLSGATWDHPER
ncbi:LysR family transcriptional regulator [Vitiosangium sp. GDMCC 1.1324]|uniref:LysR family transcriptional regulator n=1 Tax=Vitiosangium sp. (strain GDMCC 1.1324) TaxID=2138576 RepID=UPI00130DB2B7|nr:LysR family transcriptional regulator [Vitiosangium sp. GDMCC 1.1324]